MKRAPKRIQRKRVKGWRLPKNAVCVTRPGVFGNPFVLEKHETDRSLAVDLFRTWLTRSRMGDPWEEKRWALQDRLKELSGKDLACWCKPGAPCHADVLLELANK
jgi:hypothetical protein